MGDSSGNKSLKKKTKTQNKQTNKQSREQRKAHSDSNCKKCKKCTSQNMENCLGDSKPLVCIRLIFNPQLWPYGWCVPFPAGRLEPLGIRVP